jgi:hypothetical protein
MTFLATMGIDRVSDAMVRINGRRFRHLAWNRKSWCGREDSNFHEVTPTSTSSLRVYHSATTAP